MILSGNVLNRAGWQVWYEKFPSARDGAGELVVVSASDHIFPCMASAWALE